MGNWRYGVVLDAGSSGTRVHVYRWLNNDAALKKATDAQLHSLPVLETDKKWTKKTYPGISTFGEHPHHVGPKHLHKLFKHALKYIPDQEVPNTPLFLLATAGMRILPEQQQKQVLKEACDYAQNTTKFQLPDCDKHVQVISGETEGLYGWTAANYLLGGFAQPKDEPQANGRSTYGFLDMGGASAQIAFAPNATEAEKHADDLTLMRLRTIDGTSLEHRIFVTTWLGFGVNQARERYIKALLESSSSKELPDPCLPSGLTVKVTKNGKPIDSDHDDHDEPKQKVAAELVGTGKFSECLHATFPLLEKEKKCTDTPCLINGQHVPAIDFNINHFLGVSEYWYTMHEIFGKDHEEKAYDFKTYQERVDEFCSLDWSSIEEDAKKGKWGSAVDVEKARRVCFKASWVINMLHDGIGVPRVGIEDLGSSKNTTKEVIDKAKEKGFIDPFKPVDKINDVELSWTLGKMVLYASSEIPPLSEEALAVGFGSNVAGIPTDFQYPGGVPKAWEVESDWHRLFVDNPRRIPGFFIMIFIVIFIFCIILGKERRASAKQSITNIFARKQGKDPLHRRRGRGLSSKLFGLGGASTTQPYERVDLEDGQAANEFELEDTYLDSSDNELSDSSESSRRGRTSGWATPQIKTEAPSSLGYFGIQGSDVSSQGAGLGLGPPSAFDRTGLLSRTDSRERIRSRASSPKRLKGMGKLDE